MGKGEVRTWVNKGKKQINKRQHNNQGNRQKERWAHNKCRQLVQQLRGFSRILRDFLWKQNLSSKKEVYQRQKILEEIFFAFLGNIAQRNMFPQVNK